MPLAMRAGMTQQSMLLQLVRTTLRAHHYRARLQRRWYDWIRRFLRFCGHRHPSQFGAAEIQAFLNYAVQHHRASSSAVNHALMALLFLYGDVLGIDTQHYRFERPDRPARALHVLFPLEVEALLSQLQGRIRLIARLLYDGSLHLHECLSLRIKDVDIEQHVLHIRGRKGRPDRIAPLSPAVIPDLRAYLHSVREQHDRDLLEGAGYVAIPEIIRLDCPNAVRAWPWQWCFPATQTYVHQVSGHRCRHHLHESVVQRAIRQAAPAAYLGEHVSASTLSRSRGTELLDGECAADAHDAPYQDLRFIDAQ